MQLANSYRIKKQINTKYFDRAILFFGLFYAIKQSQLDYIGLQIIKYPMLISSVGFSLLSIWHNYKWGVFNTSMFFILLVISFYLRIAYNSNILISSMLILASYNIPFEHITRQCLKTIMIVFFIVLLALAFGLVEDRLYRRDVDFFSGSYAHDIGFKYYSFSYLGMGIVQCCIYIWRKHLSLYKIVFLMIISYIFFILSSTRLQLYTCSTFIFLIFILPYIPKVILNNKILATLAIIAYPLICIALYYVSKHSILSSFYEHYEELNSAMSGRLRLNEEAFMRYDVTLWGNDLDMETTIRSSKYYFYIDSGYLHTLLGDGLVFTAIILLLYSILTYKLFKAKAYYLYIWIIMYAILNISNGFLVSLLTNPILLLAFSDMNSIHNDYYLEEKS